MNVTAYSQNQHLLLKNQIVAAVIAVIYELGIVAWKDLGKPVWIEVWEQDLRSRWTAPLAGYLVGVQPWRRLTRKGQPALFSWLRHAKQGRAKSASYHNVMPSDGMRR